MEQDIRIVILQRGWVMVGRYSREGYDCKLEGASVIRKWGTTKGLGQLRNGPLSQTILDPAGEVEFHQLTVIATIKCEWQSWADHCK
jgi:hypothetical protein